MNLVVVSNRVARAKTDEPMTGGLAAALLPVVRNSGAIWVGSNVRSSGRGEGHPLAGVESFGEGALAKVEFPPEHYRGFYEGFSNSALWPMLHSRSDLIHTTDRDFDHYGEVNALMARAAARLAKPGASFWVHDYHFLLLGRELHKLGVRAPIGFFLHTPFPMRSVVADLPHHKEIVRAMLDYDLIGFQTEDDTTNFIDYVQKKLGIAVVDGVAFSERGATRIGTFPIGIDAKAFSDRAIKAFARPDVMRLRSGLQGTQLVIGVDRLDYSKGLANRFRAIDRLLLARPNLKRTFSLMQIAVPSRERIDTYRTLKAELAGLIGEINGRHGEVDWEPIRYLNKAFGQATLAGFYRAAQVGLVTPLRDGMNLVAKEYVAAQNPFDPGVLVLSQFAGAAKQLDAAVLVNPHDVERVGLAVARALAMPQEERRERHQAMMKTLESSSLASWFSDFMAALNAAPPVRREIRQPERTVVPLPRRRPELAIVRTH